MCQECANCSGVPEVIEPEGLRWLLSAGKRTNFCERSFHALREDKPRQRTSREGIAQNGVSTGERSRARFDDAFAMSVQDRIVRGEERSGRSHAR